MLYTKIDEINIVCNIRKDGIWTMGRTIFHNLSTGLEEIPAPDDLSDHFDQSYQTEFSRAG